MVMAWRINRLMRLGRSLPRLAASLLFEKQGWTAAYALNRKVPTKKEPKQGEVIRLIKQLGGFLGRKRDGEPGAKTLWRGLRDVTVSVDVMQAIRDGSFYAIVYP